MSADEPAAVTLDDVLAELTNEQRAAAIALLHGPPPDDPADPLVGYARPVTRRGRPLAHGRPMHDLPPL